MSSGAPSGIDLASFASRAREIDIGGDGDIVELGDDLGMGLLSNPSKVPASPRQVSFGGGGGGGGGGELPSISIRPVADLDDMVNVDAAPGAADIRLNRAEEPPPFVINTGSGSAMMGGGGDMGGDSGMSAEEENRKKREYLTKLQRLDANGIKGQRMSMGNSLADIRAEFDKLTDSRELESSIRFYRNAMMTFVSGVEMANDKFGQRLPVKPRLKGWSESVHTNIEDYDSIFEELHDLYKDRAKMHPLVRLVGTLGVSGVMYHLTNTMAERSGIPGMSDILNEDPELQRVIAAKMAARMGGLGNFMSAASGIGGPGPEPMGMPSMAPMQRPPTPPGRQAMDSRAPGGAFNMASGQQEAPRARREMRGPTGVDDIIKAFEAERAMAANAPPVSGNHAGVFAPSGPNPSSMGSSMLREGVGSSVDPMAEFMAAADDISVGSGSTMNTERRRRGRRAAAPVGATLNLNV
jgi:hypothetical protein